MYRYDISSQEKNALAEKNFDLLTKLRDPHSATHANHLQGFANMIF